MVDQPVLVDIVDASMKPGKSYRFITVYSQRSLPITDSDHMLIFIFDKLLSSNDF